MAFNRKPYIPSKELLEDFYINKKVPIKEMARLFNTSTSTIYKWLDATDLKKIKRKIPEKKSGRISKAGFRKSLGIYVRSSWEANYGIYLNNEIKRGYVVKWEYEPDTFYFNNIKKGTRTYTPDFKVWYKGETKHVYIEIKGWMDNISKTKLNRMAKYYPEEKIIVVGEAEYKALEKTWKPLLKEWE